MVCKGWGLAALLALGGCAAGETGQTDQAGSTSTATDQHIEWFSPMQPANAPQAPGNGDWANWLAAPWYGADGQPDHFDAIRMICPDGDCVSDQRRQVGSCDALFAADRDGLDVPGMDETQARYLARRLRCHAARLIASASPAASSHVAQFSMQGSDLRGLPVELGYATGPEQTGTMRELRDAGGDLGAFLDTLPGATRPAAVGEPDTGTRIVDGDNWTREWLLLARGDFNLDGVEDLLVAANLYITDEELLFGTRLYVVGKPRADSPMSVIQQIPLLGSEDSCDELVELCGNEIVTTAR